MTPRSETRPSNQGNRAARASSGGPADFARLGDLLGREKPSVDPPSRRLSRVWEEVVGLEVARNTQPRSLRGGRLTVATSSSVWAQTLQLLSGQIVARVNTALGEALLREAVFRPAGWDPGGGAGGPRAMSGEWQLPETGAEEAGASGATGRRGTLPGRRLTAEEEGAIDAVRQLACDEALGQRIAGAMRAALRHSPPG